jgi:hypothetical protein
MANWNKKIGLSVLSLGLLAMTPNVASANDCYSCDPCCDPCSLGGFEVGVDFIYWKPCFDNTEWAVREYSTTGTTTPVTSEYNSSYQGICPSWEPGVRVRVAKRDIFCDWTLSGSYTWIHSTDNSSVHAGGVNGTSSDFVTSPLFAPGIANNFSSTTDLVTFTDGAATWKSNYQTWDVLLSYDFNCNRCSVFTPFFGVEGLILSQQLDAEFNYYNEASGNVSGSSNGSSGQTISGSGQGLVDEAAWVNWKSSYFGVGLKLGTDYVFNLFDCLKLFARASGSIVIGNNDSHSHQGYKYGNGTGAATFQTLGKYKDDDCCLIVPGYNIALGVQYDSCWCGTDVALRLGWEFVQWFNVANPRSYGSNSFLNTANHAFATSASSPNTSTIGYQGLTVGLDVRF